MIIKYGIWHGNPKTLDGFEWYPQNDENYVFTDLNMAYKFVEERKKEFPNLIYDVKEYKG